MKSAEAQFQEAFAELRRHGLLLLTDARLPSVAGLIAGEPVRGSWWAHPRGHAIFQAAGKLADHPEVLVTKLISGKVTFVHRRLWPALLAVATCGELWQKRGLSGAARSLLRDVTRQGLLAKQSGDAARELENRLLVYSEQFHTESGAHAKRLESWEHWAGRVGFSGRRADAHVGTLLAAPPAGTASCTQEAKQELEEALWVLNARFSAAGRLPWQSGEPPRPAK